MTESDVITPDAAPASSERRRRGGVSGMVLAELRELAGTLGVTDTTGMRRGDLINEIKKRQTEVGAGAAQLPLGDSAAADDVAEAAATTEAPATPVEVEPAPAEAAPAEVASDEKPARRRASRRRATTPDDAAPEPTPAEAVTATTDAPVADADAAVATPAAEGQDAPSSGTDTAAGAPSSDDGAPARRSRRSARRDAGPGTSGDATPGETEGASDEAPGESSREDGRHDRGQQQDQADPDDDSGRDGNRGGRRRGNQNRQQDQGNNRQQDQGNNRQQDQGQNRQQDQGNNRQQDQRQQDQGQRDDRPRNERQNDDRQQGQRPDANAANNNAYDDDEDDDGTGRRRGRRFRDRRRNRNERGQGGQGSGQQQDTREPEVRDDDVLIPVAGILDVLDNYAFVRTSGYMSGSNDVYVSLSLVRKYGLRRGDAVTGQVRQQRENEQNRQKFNPLVRVDSINGLDPEQAKRRPEFTKLTPLYPNQRLRLETESHLMSTRVIDLVMPVGKGQRALIVSPPKAGKTMVLQAIANAITTNNPEVHLMVVLVDERPEEVTDMQRTVKGEVIASTFDRPPSDHTSVAELSIERAKRLVEQGHDVVVLLDSITRLGRAYNLAAPASGRILSGGVDSTALYPPKRFLGAARNIEDGGSLTIFATALVETGSTMDTVIFEEFKGTGNAELKLDRKLADKRIFPAIDPDASSTRKEDLLLSPDEMAVTHKLRRVLAALDTQQAIELVLDRLRKTRTNIEFLMSIAKTMPSKDDE